MQEETQKYDLKLAYNFLKKAPKVDYIAVWFLKASKYCLTSKVKFAFVTTNSICQGEQVGMIWPHIFKMGLEIFFANKDFKWTNNAKKKAAVIVSIIGIRRNSNSKKFLFENDLKIECKNINPYLIDANNSFIERRSRSISKLHQMEYGNMAIDGGHLILSKDEKENMVSLYPYADKFIRRIYGAQEYLHDKERYCLWIHDEHLEEALSIQEIKRRVDLVEIKRSQGNDKGVRDLANRAHQFREMKSAANFSLIFPTVSSERREYVPIGFIESKDVIIAPNQAIYDPDIFLMGILSSRAHMVWLRAVAGKLKSDYRYSSSLVYNTFPFPIIDEVMKESIGLSVRGILKARSHYSELTLAQM